MEHLVNLLEFWVKFRIRAFQENNVNLHNSKPTLPLQKAMEKEIPKAKNKNFYLWKILSYSIKVKNEAKVKGMKFWHIILKLKKIVSKDFID